MLEPASTRGLRRAIKLLRKKKAPGCPRGALLKLLIEEAGPAVSLRPTPEQAARAAFIDAGKAYCIAKCGGCPLTEGYVPPE